MNSDVCGVEIMLQYHVHTSVHAKVCAHVGMHVYMHVYFVFGHIHPISFSCSPSMHLISSSFHLLIMFYFATE